MKTKILSFLVVLMSAWLGNVAYAQLFSCDRVLIYVKAGKEPSKAASVKVIGYFADNDEIRNWTSSAERFRKSITSNSEYFRSPYNIPNKIGTLSQACIAPKWCQYNSIGVKSLSCEAVEVGLSAFMMTFVMFVMILTMM